MDPFTEKELMDNLKSIAVSLRNIDRKIDDMAISLREIASGSDSEDEISGSSKKLSEETEIGAE